MPCPAPESLVAFHGGDLADPDRVALERHIDGCGDCRAALSEAARSLASGSGRDDHGDDGPAPGARVGRYLLGDVLGRGAMGVVHRATDPDLDRELAIKIVSWREGEAALDGEQRRARALREGKALARVSHPNVTAVHDVGVWRDRVWVAMELVRGETVAAWLARGDRSPEEIAAVFRQAALGLAAAHAAGVVHRDVKPSNLLVGEDGRVRVSDFGLAFAAVEDATPDPGALIAEPWQTRSGIVLGTPAYMAPEQLAGQAADAHSDQFALCLALWEALVGAMPQRAVSVAELRDQRLAGPPVIAASKAPRRLRACLRRGLAPAPSERFADLAELAAALELRRSRWLPALGVATALVVTTVVVVGGGRGGDPCSDASASAIAESWNAERRAAIAAAFARTSLPYQARATRRVTAALDDHARRWRSLRTASCSAARNGELSTEIASARDACFHRVRSRLDLAARALADIDRASLGRADEVVEGLEPPESCAVVAGAEATPSPALAARLDALELESRLRPDAAGIAGLRALARDASASGDRRVVAQALLAVGRLHRELGNPEEARAALTEAIAAAEHAHADRLRALAWIHYVEASGDEAADLDDASRAAILADGALDRLDRPADLVGALDAARARLALRRGDAREAIEALRRSLARPGLHPTEEAARRTVMATALSQLGRHEDMLAELEQAEALIEATLGPDHPKLAAVLNDMVEPLYNLDRTADAIAALERAGRIFEASFGDADPRLAAVYDNLGVLAALREDYDAATGYSERALAISSARLGADHPDVATSHLNLGSMHRNAGRDARAAEHYQRALEIWERALGPDHPNVAHALDGLARIALESDRPADAVVLAERALAIRSSRDGPPTTRARAEFLLARALATAATSPARARRLGRAARDRYRSASDHEHAAEIDDWLGQALRRPPATSP